MIPLLRYTLDLFDLPAPQAPRPEPASLPSSPRAPFEAGQPIAQVAGRIAFVHPRASRELQLEDVVVAYEFTRARRKTIGFVVGPDGLSVRAPRWTPLYEVDAALKEKGRWIVRKLHESQERQRRQESARIEWCDGVEVPYLGRSIKVVLDPAHGFSGRGAHLDSTTLALDMAVLRVGLPHQATPAQIRDSVQAWLMRQAQALFTERLNYFAPLLGVRWTRMRLSSAGTRWGSASADGVIRLNWRLIHMRQALIDYVVAHELSHLREMNHSPQFWDTVATVVPDYSELRSQLKADPIPKW